MRFIARVLVFAIIGTPTLSQNMATCPSCAQELSLSLDEWTCLSRNLDLYARVSTDPILVSLAGCATVTEALKRDRNNNPRITVDPAAEDAAARPQYIPAFRLTKSQISCLTQQIEIILTEPPDIFRFETGCGAP